MNYGKKKQQQKKKKKKKKRNSPCVLWFWYPYSTIPVVFYRDSKAGLNCLWFYMEVKKNACGFVAHSNSTLLYKKNQLNSLTPVNRNPNFS